MSNGAGHLVDGGLAGRTDAQQRVVDAPDGAKQAHERCGRAHRGQDGHAALQVGRELVYGVAQLARHPVAHVELVVQLWARCGDTCAGADTVLAQDVAGGIASRFGQLPERAGVVCAEFLQAVFKVGGMPERLSLPSRSAMAAQIQRFDDDDHPRGQRHAQQDERHRACHRVALCPHVGQSELIVHGSDTPKNNSVKLNKYERISLFFIQTDHPFASWALHMLCERVGCMLPEPARGCGMGAEVGASGGHHSSTKLMGTLNHMALGSPLTLPGTYFQASTVLRAVWSRRS